MLSEALKPAVSIIIPAYNAEKYIDECLESVLSQDFTDLEIIIINDASTDSTLQKLFVWADSDPRIQVIDLKENKGVSHARNTGINAARGTFICFVDSDDCLLPSAIRLMHDSMIKHDADICRTSFYRGPVYKRIQEGPLKYRLYCWEEAVEVALYQKVIMNQVWSMLVKTEIVREAGMFREGTWYEDLDAFYRFFERAGKILYIENPLYFYRANPSSFLGTWKEGRLDVLDVTDRLVAYVANRYPGLVNAAHDRRFSAHYNILMLMYHNGVNNPSAESRCLSVIREGRLRAIRDPRVRIKNKLGALISYVGTPLLKLFSKLYS